jgi:hypothetical protein
MKLTLDRAIFSPSVSRFFFSLRLLMMSDEREEKKEVDS